MDARLAAYLELNRFDDEELVAWLYRLVLRRPPEAAALERTVEKLRAGTISPATLLQELVSADEFGRVRALDDAVAFARWAREADERPRGLTASTGLDERPIEISWVLARYRSERRVLDVGYAFAEPAYLAALLAAAPEEVVGVDLAEGSVPGIRGVQADVRKLPFPSRSFDVAFCISTLEHVGRDNSIYGVDPRLDPEGMTKALRELRRVLGRGGRLLLTVPCGRHEEHDWFVQLEVGAWLELFRSSGFLAFEHEAYVLTDAGWRSDTGFAATGVAYGARGPGASAVLCAELHPARLIARARALVRAARRR